jgi:hypothetical protein
MVKRSNLTKNVKSWRCEFSIFPSDIPAPEVVRWHPAHSVSNTFRTQVSVVHGPTHCRTNTLTQDTCKGKFMSQVSRCRCHIPIHVSFRSCLPGFDVNVKLKGIGYSCSRSSTNLGAGTKNNRARAYRWEVRFATPVPYMLARVYFAFLGGLL